MGVGGLLEPNELSHQEITRFLFVLKKKKKTANGSLSMSEPAWEITMRHLLLVLQSRAGERNACPETGPLIALGFTWADNIPWGWE